MDFEWQAPDGTSFPAKCWGDAAKASAVIVFVHGLGGAISDFDSLASHLATKGFVGYAATVRGQGQDPSERRRGTSLDPRGIANDLSAFARENHQPGKPFFLCGESLGALLVAWSLANDVPLPSTDGVIFSVPVVTLSRETPGIVRLALRWAARVIPRARLKPSWFVSGTNRMPQTSRDEEWLALQRTGPQHIGAFSFSVLDGMGRLMEIMPHCAQKIQTRSLVLAAGKDIFIRTDQVKGWYDLLPAEDKTFLEYPEAYHVLWNDFDRETVIQDIHTWLAESAFSTRGV
ncbi:MAG: alpha/beta fold hydrolase [Terrimicrobiaceae bacterium]